MYSDMNKQELKALKIQLDLEYKKYQEKSFNLDMSRGKPNSEQIDFSNDLNTLSWSKDDYISENGLDVRNYGMLTGIPEAKKLFAELFDVNPENVIVGGNSSLTLMFDTISKAFTKGICGSTPWSKLDKIKFLCPVPGYDRHFAITEYFGIEMINIPLLENGPDMELVKKYVEEDPTVKGIWCVPKYSNPTGITYSDEVVKSFAALNPKADDFRIFWDNAYYVHDIFSEDKLLNIIAESAKLGNPDIVYQFASTSKVTFAGSGVAVIVSSETNIKDLSDTLFYQTISYDKVNQLRHVRFLKNTENIKNHMKLHARILSAKFNVILEGLESNISNTGIASWTKPNGGYFISVNLINGTAKNTVKLCKNAGLVLTGAGAAYPYGIDPNDSNIRLSPSYPSVDDLSLAVDLFCLCAKISAVEKLLENTK